MKKTDEKIIRFIKEFELIKRGDKILIALSGGPDSVFLFYFLLKYRKKYGIEIASMHVNHLIRGKEADRDEKYCKDLCEASSITYYSVKRDVPEFARKNKISIEEAAREIRYKELSSVQKKFGYDKIATAHNCNDNAETVLLNLIKGAGIKGLAGIPIIRQSIIRPILSISKEEILSYLKKNKINYLIDKTNFSNVHERNFIRNEILPRIKTNLNPKIEQALFKSSLVLKKQSSIIQSAIKILSEWVVIRKKEKLEINNEKLAEINENLWGDVIKFSIERNFSVQISFDDCCKIISLQSNQTGKTVNISGNIKALRERNNILIFQNNVEKKRDLIELKIGDSKKIGQKRIVIDFIDKHSIKYSPNKNTEYINADEVNKKFTLRSWKDGDSFYPLGLNGKKNVSDFLNDQKVPVLEKRKQLVLINNKKIVWVVGHRIDDRYKITDKTRKVLKLCLK